MFELVIGGARSGKSAYAEQCALEFSNLNTNSAAGSVYFIATATAGDDEMETRIQHHKASRPQNWQTLEEPIELAEALKQANTKSGFIIVDCLTLWLTNLLALNDKQRQSEINALFTGLSEITSSVIFVTNEIGSGIVPMGKETRWFVDEAGRLHQRLAAKCQRVTQMIAGIPNRIKNEPDNDESKS